jgi:ABC-2 type transport system ATP-binding protein
VRFESVSLRYARKAPWVLEEVELELAPGAAAIVVGRNGEGKSTLLAAAAGLLRPGRGRIQDRPRSIGWVPERFPATLPFTTRAYLRGMARVRGLRPPAAELAIGAWADRLHLTPFLDTRLADASKGTAQKVGLAQALLAPPALLVLDEPWEGLDAQTRQQVPAIVAEVLASGASVLISDHLGEVAQIPGASRWLVHDGRVSPQSPEHEERCVVEIAVAARDVPATVERLRAEGHDVRGVRVVGGPS